MALLKKEILSILESSLDVEEQNEKIDKLLGFNHDEVESKVHAIDDNTYLNHSSRALYTSYQDFFQILKSLRLKNKTFCDLGAGVARSKILFNIIDPTIRSIAIEYEKQRYQEGLKILKQNKLDTTDYLNEDLFNIEIPKADCYFIYLPDGPILDHVLQNLPYDQDTKIVVIDSHGESFFQINQNQKWLKIYKQVPLKSQRHHSFANIYCPINKRMKRNFPENFYELTSTHNYIKIEEDDSSWIASLKSANYYSFGIELKYPPRIVQIDNISRCESFNEEISSILQKRNSREKYKYGEIRKVFTSPKVLIEFSNGKRIPLSSFRELL